MTANVPPTLPFAEAEYRERHAKVRAALAARGIGALVVTNPANVLYLTGYQASWYSPRLPTGVLVAADSDELVFLDWSRHAEYARRCALYDSTALFEYGDCATVVAEAVRARGWAGGTVALEWQALNPVGGVIRAIGAELERSGATVVDDDWLVDTVRLYKSPAEVERVRRAAAMADTAFAQLTEDLRPGLTELDVAARIITLLTAAGSELAASPPLVSSGPTAWCDQHAPASRRVLERGDIVTLDICAVVDRYHANLSRSWALGDPSPLAREVLEHAAAGWPVLRDAARLGEGPEVAMAAAEAAIRAHVAPERVWWIGGYALGLGLPPSWVGHGYLANDGPTRVTLQPGYVSNYELVFFDPGEGFAVNAIDTLVMATDGLELLSTLPRGLLEAAG